MPLPLGVATVRRVVAPGAAGVNARDGDSGSAAADGAGSRLVYSNTLGAYVFAPLLANARMADDITTTAAHGCPLDRFVFRVSGNSDGTGVGPFSVTFALYEVCPGSSLTPEPIAGTSGIADLPDEGVYDIEVTIPTDQVTSLPTSFYLGLRFSREKAGVVLGAPALVGFSADAFDYPIAARCATRFASGVHASFHAQFYVREPCGSTFPVYRNTQQAAPAFTAGAETRFADDIQLVGEPCNLVAYEVSVRAITRTGYGGIEVDLRTELSNSDPWNGGVIERTRAQGFVFGDQARMFRKVFDPPVPLPQNNLWMAFRTSSSVVGSILTCRASDIGTTLDSYQVFRNARWEPADAGSACHAAFDIRLYCAGEAPIGACCDTLFVTNGACAGGLRDGKPCGSWRDCPQGEPGSGHRLCVGDAVCREVARLNCSDNRWMEGAACNPDLFSPACGRAACCLPDDTCADLTQAECLRAAPPGDEIFWQRTASCETPLFQCPIYACLQRRGDCEAPHEDRGCENAFCCVPVCLYDPYCCDVAWDQLCVDLAAEFCHFEPPPNDSCFSPEATKGAIAIPEHGSVNVIVANAVRNGADPALCCVGGTQSSQGYQSTWYTFTSRYSSVRVRTFEANPWNLDTLVQVYQALDSSSSAAACSSLSPIACNDDAPGVDGGVSDVCVTDLVPGETYYVEVVTKKNGAGLALSVGVESPCRSQSLVVNDDCRQATAVTEPLVSYDLNGAGTDCVNVPVDRFDLPECGMDREVWFDWTVPATGLAVLRVLGPDGALLPNGRVHAYRGCGCPAEFDELGRCNLYTALVPGAATFHVAESECFKIRVGDSAGAAPTGVLSAEVMQCGEGPVRFVDPPHTAVDAAQPYASYRAWERLGFQQFVVEVPDGGNNPLCWRLCEDDDPGFRNYIREISTNGDGTITLTLARAITPGGMSSLIFTDQNARNWAGHFISSPGNVNADGYTSSEDVAALADTLAALSPSAEETRLADVDRSGAATPADLLREIDLLGGALEFGPSWDGHRKPTSPPHDCP